MATSVTITRSKERYNPICVERAANCVHGNQVVVNYLIINGGYCLLFTTEILSYSISQFL